jgi:hypothetical protein
LWLAVSIMALGQPGDAFGPYRRDCASRGQRRGVQLWLRLIVRLLGRLSEALEARRLGVFGHLANREIRQDAPRLILDVCDWLTPYSSATTTRFLRSRLILITSARVSSVRLLRLRFSR